MKKLLATAAIAVASLAGITGMAGTASADVITSGPLSGSSSIVVDTGTSVWSGEPVSAGIITSGPVSGSSSIVVDTGTVGTDLTDPTPRPADPAAARIKQDSKAVYLTQIADGTFPRTQTISNAPSAPETVVPWWLTLIGGPR